MIALEGDAVEQSSPPPLVGFPLLYAAILVAATGNLAMMSLFPAIARLSGIPDLAMVTVQSASAALSILATPIWAHRSDRVGRKPIILIGMAGFTIASALTACAIFAAVHHLLPVAVAIAALMGSRAVFGCIGLASAPAIQAFVADRTEPAQRTRTLSTLYSAQGLGSIIGPGIAPLLILPFVGLAGPQLIFTLLGIVVMVLLSVHLPDDTKKIAPSTAPAGKMEVLRRSTVWPFVAFLAVLSGSQAANLQMVGYVIIDRLGLAPIAAQPFTGAAIMLGAGAAVSIQLGLLRWLRLPPLWMMGGGILLVALGNAVMAFAGSFTMVVIAFVLASAGAAFATPGAASAASLANDAPSQGSVAGMTTAAMTSGLLVAPVAAMLLYKIDPSMAFYVIAAFLCGTLAVLLPKIMSALRDI